MKTKIFAAVALFLFALTVPAAFAAAPYLPVAREMRALLGNAVSVCASGCNYTSVAAADTALQARSDHGAGWRIIVVDTTSTAGSLTSQAHLWGPAVSSAATMTSITGPTGITWTNSTTDASGAFDSQTAGKFLGSPATTSGAPTFRTLVGTDIATALTAIAGDHGANLSITPVASELITLSTSGATTDSSTNLLPANSLILAVECRVDTSITTATDWSVGDGSTAARFCAADSTMTAGEAEICTAHWAAGAQWQAAAAKLRITTTGTPGAGKVRCQTFALTFTAPTS